MLGPPFLGGRFVGSVAKTDFGRIKPQDVVVGRYSRYNILW
jgi:hypothetical protein